MVEYKIQQVMIHEKYKNKNDSLIELYPGRRKASAQRCNLGCTLVGLGEKSAYHILL